MSVSVCVYFKYSKTLKQVTSDGFQTIQQGSNDFFVFQNNFSLNILKDLPAWEMGFKSAVKGHLSGELAWEWACPCQEWWFKGGGG